jgi:GT2 family glycosyltransferase
MSDRPAISFVIATRNRRDAILHTLRQIARFDDGEVFLVDNASTDGTAEAVRRQFPHTQMILLPENRGAVAKNAALDRVRGKLVMFLDDDSAPTPGTVELARRHFEADPRLGAAVCRVRLPDGTEESSAYPGIIIGCGSILRTSALREVGGLPNCFFMQAEEYDLSLRLLHAGWDIRHFDDLQVVHQKTPVSRIPSRTLRLDVRNNLLLAVRRLPAGVAFRVGMEWLRRYYWIAQAQGNTRPFWSGVVQGLLASVDLSKRQPVAAGTWERVCCERALQAWMAELSQQHNIRTIVLAGLGKAAGTFVRAARGAGLTILSIADDRLTRPGRRWQGIDVTSESDAMTQGPDAVVVCSLSPAHIRPIRRAWRSRAPATPVFGFETDAQASGARNTAGRLSLFNRPAENLHSTSATTFWRQAG